MKSSCVAFLLTAVLSAQAFASAKVTYSSQSGSIELSAHIYFYGPDASNEIAKQAVDEINLYWNGGSHLNASTLPLNVYFGANQVTFKMKVTGEVTSEERAMKLLGGEPAPEMNFINLLPGDALNGDRSFMDFLCGRTGTWYVSDDLRKSTTAAHEFGHGLCLDHPRDSDYRGQGQPPVMAARGTLVDSIYQWTPGAPSGGTGGTLNPYKRRVIEAEVNELHLEFLPYNSSGVAYLRGYSAPSFIHGRTD